MTDLGVFDQATATFTLRLVDANAQVWTSQLPLGAAGDLPVAGDWDGDAITDLGVWAPATATFTQGRAVFSMTTPLPAAVPDAIAPAWTTTTVSSACPAAEAHRSGLRPGWPGRRGAASRPPGC